MCLVELSCVAACGCLVFVPRKLHGGLDVVGLLECCRDKVVAEGVGCDGLVVLTEACQDIGGECVGGPVVDDVGYCPAGDREDAFAGAFVVSGE